MDRIVLKADSGKIYTNGESYGHIIYLAVGEDASEYYQITEEEHKAKTEKERKKNSKRNGI